MRKLPSFTLNDPRLTVLDMATFSPTSNRVCMIYDEMKTRMGLDVARAVLAGSRSKTARNISEVYPSWVVY